MIWDEAPVSQWARPVADAKLAIQPRVCLQAAALSKPAGTWQPGPQFHIGNVRPIFELAGEI